MTILWLILAVRISVIPIGTQPVIVHAGAPYAKPFDRCEAIGEVRQRWWEPTSAALFEELAEQAEKKGGNAVQVIKWVKKVGHYSGSGIAYRCPGVERVEGR